MITDYWRLFRLVKSFAPGVTRRAWSRRRGNGCSTAGPQCSSGESTQIGKPANSYSCSRKQRWGVTSEQLLMSPQTEVRSDQRIQAGGHAQSRNYQLKYGPTSKATGRQTQRFMKKKKTRKIKRLQQEQITQWPGQHKISCLKSWPMKQFKIVFVENSLSDAQSLKKITWLWFDVAGAAVRL